MPTLLNTAVKHPGVSPTGPGTMTTSITLSFQGVKFCLRPADCYGEVSYKSNSTDNDSGVLISLNSFTGTLSISHTSNEKLSILSTKNSTQTSADIEGPGSDRQGVLKTFVTTVEQEPNSPYTASSIVPKEVSPGHQKLTLTKTTVQTRNQEKGATKRQPKGKNQKRKRQKTFTEKREDDANAETPKMSRKTIKRAHLSETSSPVGAPKTLSQLDNSDTTLLCQQPTQDEMLHDFSVPDLSQTMDSVKNSTSVEIRDSVAFSNDEFLQGGLLNTSVQDILDLVNSTGGSVAPALNGEDDDEVATDMEGEEEVHNDTIAANPRDDKLIDENAIDSKAMSETDFKGYGPPCPRWGATMTKIQDDMFLVYGGQSYDEDGNPIILSDVHLYNPETKTWERPINSRGEKRQWHSSVYVPSRKQLIAFGGETLDNLSTEKKNEGKVVITDTLRVLDTDIMLWYPPAATGDIPTGRSGHSSVYFRHTNEMVLFGGVRGSKWLNSVSILDISSWVWTTPKVEGSPPKPRSFHSSTALGNRMVVFGGNNKTSCFNTVHVFEPKANDRENDSFKSSCCWKWSHPTVKGTPPVSRTGHSATLLEDRKTICIYGGWDPNEDDQNGKENIFHGSYLLDTEEWTWKEGPRAVAGGSGSEIHTVEDCGAKRCGHQALLNGKTGEIIVFGGRIPGEVLAGDFQRLDP